MKNVSNTANELETLYKTCYYSTCYKQPLLYIYDIPDEFYS